MRNTEIINFFNCGERTNLGMQFTNAMWNLNLKCVCIFAHRHTKVSYGFAIPFSEW